MDNSSTLQFIWEFWNIYERKWFFSIEYFHIESWDFEIILGILSTIRCSTPPTVFDILRAMSLSWTSSLGSLFLIDLSIRCHHVLMVYIFSLFSVLHIQKFYYSSSIFILQICPSHNIFFLFNPVYNISLDNLGV